LEIVVGLTTGVATLYQFIIYDIKFVFEPYRRKRRKDPTLFYKKVIDKASNEFLLNFVMNIKYI